MATGILAAGIYLPQRRLQRVEIARAHGWFDSSLRGLGSGERCIAAWDEDSITLAVEAARNALLGFDRDSIDALYMGSTSYPFLDRQSTAVVAEALNLAATTRTMDIAGSQRAGTSALLAALRGARLGEMGLVLASEQRRTKAASRAEMMYGDGSAAVLVGDGEVVAELVDAYSETVDFVDHYRTADSEFDYDWEERWVREEGLLKIVPPVVANALSSAGVKADEITHLCCGIGTNSELHGLAGRMGISPDNVMDNLHDRCGRTGAAHPLLLLVAALEKAKPEDLILLVGFGQGCDVLLFRATHRVNSMNREGGVAANLARGAADRNYSRYLTINHLISMEHGIRAELDKNTGLSTAYRNRELTSGLIGGRCTVCGTLQIPATNVCVQPDCGAIGSQVAHPFADVPAELKSYTGDNLTYTIDPPAYYGMVQFRGGGRIMADFADVLPDLGLSVGMPMRMVFRVKDYDHKRGFRRYFWKAAPAYADAGG
ncbi:MAG: 3-oxoacyl-[acyl-carrier-protein] synthase III C-terminal domain-containing protein [Pseudomonadota bacterium]